MIERFSVTDVTHYHKYHISGGGGERRGGEDEKRRRRKEKRGKEGEKRTKR